ncbi:MAG: thioredoxin domain-containing protein [Bacteroidetes bacterium]|nr:MAG: thioredoxin domain-containing protein [Bacteroidota bacterium]
MKILILSQILFLLSLTCSGQETIRWEPLNKATFDRAKKENKIILLNLEANWCHWCHVMHDSTYSNSKVIRYLNAHFITVMSDQDASPELAVRYKDYGWPATIFLNSEGEDVVKRRGYIPPDRYLRLLKSIVKDPSPEEFQTKLVDIQLRNQSDQLLVEELEKNFKNSLDYEVGGFDQSQKFVEYDTYEYALFTSKEPSVKSWLEKSAEGAKQLSDPEWGGIYQYSTHYDWKHLHYEKLLSIQARYMRIFSYNYLYNGDTSSLDYAKKCVAYVDEFLAAENGLYFNAQDADLIQGVHAGDYFSLRDAERRKLGIPGIDKNTFTHNNAEMASSLLLLFQVSQDSSYLYAAKRILTQLIATRKNSANLYQHTQKGEGLISLRDNVAMLDLLVQYVKYFPEDKVIGKELTLLVKGICAHFILKNGSFKGFNGENGLSPEPIVSENIKVARLLNWFGHFTGELSYTEMARRTYQFLIQKEVSQSYYSEPALLSLKNELESSPLEHVVMYKGKGGAGLERVMKACAPFYSTFIVAEMEQLPDAKREYFAGFDETVLLICTANACSAPIYSVQECVEHYRRNTGEVR